MRSSTAEQSWYAARYPLTPKQRAVLVAIVKLTRREGYPPTIREIGRLLELTHNPVAQQVKALERKGLLTRRKYTQRGLAVTPQGLRLVRTANGKSS